MDGFEPEKQSEKINARRNGGEVTSLAQCSSLCVRSPAFRRKSAQRSVQTPPEGGTTNEQPRQVECHWALVWVSVCISLCLVSGCTSMRNAWTNLTAEPGSQKCGCGSCAADENVVGGLAEQSGQPRRVASQPMYESEPTPSPEGSTPPQTFVPRASTPQQFNQSQDTRPRHYAPPNNQYPQSGAMSGTPQYWQPNPPAHFNQEQYSPGYNSPQWNGQSSEDAGWVSYPSPGTPPAEPANDALKEYRTQVQVLSEEMAQLKNAQKSMKSSQDTLQQSHEREILELKLQQATTDRDRLQRERELERELENQRRRELETIDSLSQIIEGTGIPVGAASNPGLVPTPAPAVRARRDQTNSAIQLPTVD